MTYKYKINFPLPRNLKTFPFFLIIPCLRLAHLLQQKIRIPLSLSYSLGRFMSLNIALTRGHKEDPPPPQRQTDILSEHTHNQHTTIRLSVTIHTLSTKSLQPSIHMPSRFSILSNPSLQFRHGTVSTTCDTPSKFQVATRGGMKPIAIYFEGMFIRVMLHGL